MRALKRTPTSPLAPRVICGLAAKRRADVNESHPVDRSSQAAADASEATASEASASEATAPEASAPEASASEAPAPDASATQASASEGSAPDASAPAPHVEAPPNDDADVNPPHALDRSSQPADVAPTASATEASAPETSSPAPHVEAPANGTDTNESHPFDQSSQSAANASEGSATEASAPEASASEASAPEASAPEASASEASASEASAPEASASEASASEASAPEASASEAAAPEASASEASATEASAPDAFSPTPDREAPANEDDASQTQTVGDASPAEIAATPSTEVAAATPRPPDPRAEERRRRAQQAWERVVQAREQGEILTGTVTAAVKGGLLVDVGSIRGFLPASQVRVQQGTALDTLVRSKLPLKVIDVDQSRRRIVVSHRRAADEERRTKRSEVLKSLAVGQVRDGTVVRLTDFGAFVDLGGIDGLIPMRELAFERVEKTSDVVTVGETLPVQVLRIEENGKKISLSRKNALPDPWRDHADVVRHGATVEGKVVAKEPRLQVEIAPGIIGTVRESDADPAQYDIGEAIEVTVRRADRATRRITLTTMHGASAAPPPSNSGGFAPLGIELGRR